MEEEKKITVYSIYVAALAVYIGIIISVDRLNWRKENVTVLNEVNNYCIFTLVESMPENLTYPDNAPMLMSTYVAHKRLLSNAKKSLYISSFYWTLRGKDTNMSDYSTAQGEDIFQTISDIVKSGIIDVRIAQNNTNDDTDELSKMGAQVRTLDFTKIMHAGVMHTKMWIVDEQHVYIGSANLDWRSYTQTKETGVLVENCPGLAIDAYKIFKVYWDLGKSEQVPSQWPSTYSTTINAENPALVHYNNTKATVYLSSSPPPFCPHGRTVDVDAIVSVITSAKKFIYISVMDYMPVVEYSQPQRYWPVIDDALRTAAFDRNVEVFLLTSHWAHTDRDMYAFLRSLRAVNGTKKKSVKIELKTFTVKSYTNFQKKIPFARVAHSKYMVTDQHAYIGTSNWAGDYFKSTGGVGFILQEPLNNTLKGNSLREQLLQVFLRDWKSEYVAEVF